MNKQQLKALLSVNLRYANPQVTTKARKKGKTGKALSRYLIQQFLISGILFLVIYGATMFMLDYSRMPGYFTYYVGLFSILGFSQGISAIYNIFFESQDLPAYLPLPFRQLEIFLSKIMVVSLMVVPFIIPLLILFLLTGFRSGLFIPWTILFSIFLFLLFLFILFSICSLIVFGLTRTKLFKKHKKVVTSLLLGISMTIAVVGILLMNQSVDYDSEVMDRYPLPIFMPFFYAMRQPFTMSGLVSILGLIGLAVVLGLIIYFTILPKFYEQVAAASPGITIGKRKLKQNQSLRQLLLTYNSHLIRDPNLIMQVLSSSLLTPLIFIITFAVTGAIDLSNMDIRFIGVVFLVGVFLSVMMINQTSFISNLISLDQQNFLFIRSLPISMKQYLFEKFRFGCLIQMTINGLVALIATIIFRMPFFCYPAILLGAFWGTYLLSLRYFARDYRLLLLDWTNISQLFSRGSGNMGMVLTMIGSIFIGAIIIVVYGALVNFLPFWAVTIPVIVVLGVVSFFWIRHYQHHFWRRIEP